MIAIPAHKGCFICDGESGDGMGIQWYGDVDGRVFGRIQIPQRYVGPPGHAHGGASAAILDDVMGTCCWFNGNMVMTGSMTVRYRRPVPLGEEVLVSAEIVRQEGRKIFVEGWIESGTGTRFVESEGLFVQSPEIFENSHFTEHFQGWLSRIEAAKEAASKLG